MEKSLYDCCIEWNALELLDQWDQQKNGELTPRDVSFGSHKKVWWSCAKGHSWKAGVYTRIGQKKGCPYCAGRLFDENSSTVATECPELCLEWHPDKNPGLLPTEISSGSHRKVWWRCKKGHEWFARVSSRVRGTGCPYCANRKVIPGENDLATTHPWLVQEWDFSENGTLTPDSVVAGAHRKVWWCCEKGHRWKTAVFSRTRENSSCPYCAGTRVIPGENDLASRYPEIAAQWHPEKNGELTPDQVTSFSNKRVWWKCEKGHEHYSIISQRTRILAGCPYCTNRKVLAGFNDLGTKEPRIAAQWHAELNGDLTPQMVTAGSRKKVWWQCEDGHVWKAAIYPRTSDKKVGCPVCAGKVKQVREVPIVDGYAEK